jgi:hypothetical protein
MTTYPEYNDWLERDFAAEELLRVWARFACAVREQDDGRDIGRVIDLYRDDPLAAPIIDLIMVALTGWILGTIVTGRAGDGQIPDGFEDIRYLED